MQCRGHNIRANCFGSTDVDACGAVDRIVKHDIFSSLFDLCTPLPSRYQPPARDFCPYTGNSLVTVLLYTFFWRYNLNTLLKSACIIIIRTECFSHSLCCPSWGWLLLKVSTLAGMVLLGKCMFS